MVHTYMVLVLVCMVCDVLYLVGSVLLAAESRIVPSCTAVQQYIRFFEVVRVCVLAGDRYIS